jgi:tRNA dimethylallyltransferase
LPAGTLPAKPERALVAIAGPTGSGKSDLALRVAETFSGEVVNCDSLQIYRYFDIGTAKLSSPEMRAVPHHLIDIAAPDEVFTAGEFARRGREALAEIAARGRLPVVAGGTGFYLRALIDGLFEGPSRDDRLRERLAARERRRPGTLARLLLRFDRAAAQRIHRNDLPKVMRALEVCLLARRPITELFREGRDRLRGYRVLKIGLDPGRDALYAHLDRRAERMFGGGLVDEVRRILEMGYPPEAKPFESHGYKQALQMLRGELNAREALFYAQRNTRRYAKRQMTWFRREPDIEWFRGFGNEDAVARAVVERVRDFLREAPPGV